MKNISQLLILIICSFLQVLFLPINFTLLFILFLVNQDTNKALFGFLVLGSLLVSVFGNLSFGLTLISFSLSVILFLILKKFFPSNRIGRVVPFVAVLVFWEILIRAELLFYTRLL